MKNRNAYLPFMASNLRLLQLLYVAAMPEGAISNRKGVRSQIAEAPRYRPNLSLERYIVLRPMILWSQLAVGMYCRLPQGKFVVIVRTMVTACHQVCLALLSVFFGGVVLRLEK